MVGQLVPFGREAGSAELEDEAAEPRAGDEDFDAAAVLRGELGGESGEDGGEDGGALGGAFGAPVAVELVDAATGFVEVGRGGFDAQFVEDGGVDSQLIAVLGGVGRG